MNYSKKPIGTVGMATTPTRFLNLNKPSVPPPPHTHKTHVDTHTHKFMHTHRLLNNGLIGFHGALKLGDIAGVLTRSETRERDGGRERQRERGGCDRENERKEREGSEIQRTCRAFEWERFTTHSLQTFTEVKGLYCPVSYFSVTQRS